MCDDMTSTIVELSSDNTITLPASIAQLFRPADRFLTWQYGDTLVLKRITVPRVTEVTAMTPGTEPPPSSEELDAIIHEVRTQRTEN